MVTAPIRSIERELIRTVRDARFAAGRTCAFCESRAIQRWGTFSGRQRYRCADCRRTFSDLTGTVLANSKRLHSWPAFLGCWLRSRTVRRTAVLAGVHPSTAFRWRHRFCDALRCAERPMLCGLTEALEVRFLYSRKGERGMSASMTPRTVVEQRRRRRVSVVVLRDRRGVLTGDITGGARPDLRELQRLYSDILHRDAVLLSAHRRLAPIAAAAQARGRIHVRVTPHERDPLVHIENVMGHTHRLRVWLERFRGVATRYLSNYLSWYRHLEPLQEDTAGVHFLARCCGSVYQQLSRTEPDAPALGHAPGPPRSPPVPPTGPQPPPPNVE